MNSVLGTVDVPRAVAKKQSGHQQVAPALETHPRASLAEYGVALVSVVEANLASGGGNWPEKHSTIPDIPSSQNWVASTGRNLTGGG